MHVMVNSIKCVRKSQDAHEVLTPAKHHSGLQFLSEPFDPKTKIVKSNTLNLNKEVDTLSPNQQPADG